MSEPIEKMLTLYERGAIDRRQFLGAIAVVASAAAPAALGQSTPAPAASASPGIFRGQVINHVTLSVSDASRSRAFYQRLLGATDIFPAANPNAPLRFADLRVGSGFIGLYPMGQPGRIDHFCIGIEDFNDDRVMTELRRHFPDHKPNTVPESGPGVKEVYLTDPDGIRVQLSAVDLKLE
jgi:catechol 2,3-dioxygenase-like lactoylglutathione lyase family enzyme